jgi:hypothetical protein
MHKTIRALASATLPVVASLLFSVPANAQQSAKQKLKPPANERLLLQVHGKGDQIYTCSGEGAQPTWTLKAPEAQLIDKKGEPFGKHFAGPTWQANDGSTITGKATANAPSPSPDSVPWLLVTVVSRSGDGVLARVTSVQRLNITGGKAPATGCDASHVGQEQRVPYSADYVFFAPK